MAMECWSLLIGAGKLRARARRFSRADDRLIQEITTRHFPDGFTLLHAKGGWFDAARWRFTREESRQVLICGASTAQVRAWAMAMGRALNQRELIVVRMGHALRLRLRARAPVA